MTAYQQLSTSIVGLQSNIQRFIEVFLMPPKIYRWPRRSRVLFFLLAGLICCCCSKNYRRLNLSGWNVPFEQQTLATWRRALEVKFTAIFDLCHGLMPMLRAADGASIINIASTYGIHGPDWSLYESTTMGNPAAYGASKGGLIQFTRWLATTLARAVRVNAISPGGISRNQPCQFIARYAAKIPLQRIATEDDMRGAVAYMASDLSKYVTGQTLPVDGAWGLW